MTLFYSLYCGFTTLKWVCLKMLCTPINPMVLLIIIPTKWLFHWGFGPHFQTYPNRNVAIKAQLMAVHCHRVGPFQPSAAGAVRALRQRQREAPGGVDVEVGAQRGSQVLGKKPASHGSFIRLQGDETKIVGAGLETLEIQQTHYIILYKQMDLTTWGLKPWYKRFWFCFNRTHGWISRGNMGIWPVQQDLVHAKGWTPVGYPWLTCFSFCQEEWGNELCQKLERTNFPP